MKNILFSTILSVGLSLLLVWLLLPSMEQQYWLEQGKAIAAAEQEAEQVDETDAANQPQSEAITAKVLNDKNWELTYSLLNNTSKPIKNVKIRFIYYNKKGEQVHYGDDITYCILEPGLTQSFVKIKATEAKEDDRVELQILDYNFKGLLD